MDIKKILWPTDFSENAAQALPLVTSLAEKYQAAIHILYVLKDYPEFGASYGQHDPSDYQKMKDWEKQFAESRLDEICEKFLNACPLYIRHISVGEPAKEILKMRDTLNQILFKHTGQPIEKVKKDTERDYFMTSEEAKKYGIVDKVITTREMQNQISKDKKA